MVKQRFINNFETELSVAITDTETTLDVPSADASLIDDATEEEPYRLTLVDIDESGEEVDWEVVRVTGVSGSELTVIRDDEGHGAKSWDAGTPLMARLTRRSMEDLRESASGDAPDIAMVRQPVNISPDDVTVEDPIVDLLASTYAPLYSVDARIHRQFQVDEQSGDFSDPVSDVEVNSDTTHVTLPDGDYKWRCRDLSDRNDLSDFSEPSIFSVQAEPFFAYSPAENNDEIRTVDINTGLQGPSITASGAVGLDSVNVDIDGFVYAPDKFTPEVIKWDDNGDVEWRHTTTEAPADITVAPDRSVYILDGQDDVEKLDADGGHEWTESITERIRAVTVDRDGNIYIVEDQSNEIFWHKLDPNGTEQWSDSGFASTNSGAFDIAVNASGRVFLGVRVGSIGRLICINASDGTVEWFEDFSSSVHGVATHPNGTVVAGSNDDTVRLFDQDGSHIWTFNATTSIFGVATDVFGGTIAIEGDLIRLHDDGTEDWSIDINATLDTRMKIAADVGEHPAFNI